ncbi:hypothetical protein K3148_04170 [Qipengyuania aurantiaca]|uniref:Uncharacterized protein n=1 Tax=Qipengyuania aurantiaca TaxID=2867233 RepID=A0ABX8ZNQ0_9SPHN|nr:hypothetical protein [Qipengyuania aurantiaca]QZD90597.1 hypothetical protein K3148_04170 [Qipengyuania aurantiaca]
MQTAALIAVPAYLASTFLLSALIVRFAPKAHSSRQLRKHLVLCMVLPILLVVDAIMAVDALRKLATRIMRGAFEIISGRQLLSGDEYAYAYFGYSRRRQNRRKSDRRASAAAAGKKVAVGG